MKYVEGSLIKNTLISQVAELSANIISGIIYAKFGPRLGFTSMYALSLVGSILLI
jgi:hypothetical protein